MMTSEGCMLGMAGMGLISLLLIIALVLGVVALAKYLFSRNKDDERNARKNIREDYEYHSEK
ncbi:MAG: hypothetical protein V7713_03020 [Marinobacter sp.]|uniref:hypothetical protein n=1 Tax=Marinobacter sp. AC-23 TaxID=1879031 RepID=UPI0008DCCD8E|nr:hypothetical protein [Marinobacter sp. AC-23]OHY81482.1 hypothetical protein BCA33_11375 [Marinobacter sp. AC-23]